MRLAQKWLNQLKIEAYEIPDSASIVIRTFDHFRLYLFSQEQAYASLEKSLPLL
jgi:hypothetical protein